MDYGKSGVGNIRLAAEDYFDKIDWADLPDLAPVNVVAERLGVSRQVLYRLVETGEIHGVRVGPGNIRLFRQSVLDYLRRQLT